MREASHSVAPASSCNIAPWRQPATPCRADPVNAADCKRAELTPGDSIKSAAHDGLALEGLAVVDEGLRLRRQP